MKRIIGTMLIAAFLLVNADAQRSIKLALLKYNGGGDWYSVVDALENLTQFCNEQLYMSFDRNYGTVEVGSAEIFNYPFLFMTGHGNIVFSDAEAENLRNYLLGGGFLYVDDDYGMDPYFRVAIKKVFPEKELIELPFEHPVFSQKFRFPNGAPKVHEHDNKPPQTFAILHEGRVVCVYTAESNISDGWESQEVHNNPEALRRRSLEMGANIVQFAFTQ
ncbi:MAG TPA: DUF4159 domain-containing protein [Saprospiraceae bacterium]|nr:DUF4159 domain-containing protein [Saprospiraceae bacterium]HMP23164.1 DUF4159 domain-containing protein [Saprospiraceae bacterium]